MIQEAFPQTVNDPGQHFDRVVAESRREFLAHWPGYEDTVATLNAIRNTSESDIPELVAEADRRWAPLVKNHTTFLDGVAGDIGEMLAKGGKQHLVSEEFTAKSQTPFTFDPKRPRSPLNLEALGLPRFEGRPHEGKPLAVIVHSARKPGEVSAIELVLTDGKTVNTRLLENIPAAVDPDKKESARWVGSGEPLISKESVELQTKAVENPKTHRSTLTLSATEAPYNQDDNLGNARIIRPARNRAETVIKKPFHERKPGKIRKAVGAIATLATISIALAWATPSASGSAKNEKITLATEMVLPAGTSEHKGIPQAEKYFKEPELARSRAAFDAYFKGDKKALRAQAEAQGFEPNWMSEKGFAAIEKAETFDELTREFAKAFDGLPVSLSVRNTTESLKGLHDPFKHEPATNLDSAKTLALKAMSLFNKFDKSSLLETMEPLEYVIVGDIDDPNDDFRTHGYYLNGSDKSLIVLDEDTWEPEGAVGHETGHYLDLSKKDTGDSSSVIYNLNPEDHAYTGIYNWQGTSTKVEGVNTVAEAYGNATQGEDTATATEEIVEPKTELVFEQSHLSEKQAAIIFELEKKYPGFTASLLERTSNDPAKSLAALIDAALFEMQKEKVPLGAVGVLSILFLTVRRGRAAESRSRMASYGLYNKYGEPLWVYDPGKGEFSPQTQ